MSAEMVVPPVAGMRPGLRVGAHTALPRRALLVAAAGLSACSVLPERPYRARREWPLAVRRPQVAAAPTGAPALLLRALRAGPGLDTRGLRTRLADGAEQIDLWEEWAVPPPQGVEDSLRQWLAASGLFSAVVRPGTDLQPQLVLEGELLALVADPQTGTALVELSLVLLRAEPDGRFAPLVQRSLRGEAPLRGSDGPALAAAMAAAVSALLGQAEVLLAGFARG